MDKKTFALGFIIVLVFAWGIYLHFSTAYGEQYEYSGSFPVPDNLEKTADMCFVENIGATTMMFTCKWIFTAEAIDEWFEEFTHPKITLPDCEFGYDEVTEECLDEVIIPSNFVPEVKDPLLTQYEKDLERFEEKIKAGIILSASKQDYYEKLLLLGECYRGLKDTPAYGIQEQSKYTVSNIWVDPFDATAFDYSGSHASLTLAIEECKAQIKYLLPELGPVALHKGAFKDTEQVHHGDVAITRGWETIPNQETFGPSPTAHDMFKEDKRAWEVMCDSNTVSKNYKKQQGCAIDISVGLNLDGTCRNHTVYNHDKTRCIPEFVERSSQTGIAINADPIYKLSQYKLDKGQQQLAELLMQQRLDTEAKARIVQESHK